MTLKLQEVANLGMFFHVMRVYSCLCYRTQIKATPFCMGSVTTLDLMCTLIYMLLVRSVFFTWASTKCAWRIFTQNIIVQLLMSVWFQQHFKALKRSRMTKENISLHLNKNWIWPEKPASLTANSDNPGIRLVDFSSPDACCIRWSF